jgi:predicted transcriptional regulator
MTERKGAILSASVSTELNARVKKYAEAEDRPISWVIRKCLEVGMEQMESQRSARGES